MIPWLSLVAICYKSHTRSVSFRRASHLINRNRSFSNEALSRRRGGQPAAISRRVLAIANGRLRNYFTHRIFAIAISGDSRKHTYAIFIRVL